MKLYATDNLKLSLILMDYLKSDNKHADVKVSGTETS